ncbi:MAG: hypothetical protein ACOC0Z_00045 [Halohasta sp.]
MDPIVLHHVVDHAELLGIVALTAVSSFGAGAWVSNYRRRAADRRLDEVDAADE